MVVNPIMVDKFAFLLTCLTEGLSPKSVVDGLRLSISVVGPIVALFVIFFLFWHQITNEPFALFEMWSQVRIEHEVSRE